MSVADQPEIAHGHRPVDEHANFITHGLGFALAVFAAVLLMWQVVPADSPRVLIACAVYSLALVGLYAASTLSHSFHDVDLRRFFRTIDQAFIFLLIAGSFTPFGMILLWHGWWPVLLVVMWILAFIGVGMVLRMKNLSATARMTYGFMGWLPVISLKALADSAPPGMMAWIVAGGAFYSLGTIFFAFDRQVRYFHAVWHVFVIGGSVCHYVAIAGYVAVV